MNEYWVFFTDNWKEKTRVIVYANNSTQAKILAQATRIKRGKNYTVVDCENKGE